MNQKIKNKRRKLLLILGLTLYLIFYGASYSLDLKQTQIAFIEIILFWFSILAMILITRNISKKSSWLLVPLPALVAFASVLNYLAAF